MDQYLRTKYDRVPEPPPRGPQGADQVVVPNVIPGAHGLPNPDPRNDIPGVEPAPGGQVCITVRTRRQVDPIGNVASPQNRLDGPPFVV